MLKRFVARLLIVLQVYNTLFQGVLHANIVQAHHAVRDEIYLHTAPGKDGGFRIALGTNRGGDDGGAELLEVIEVPAYGGLSKASRQQHFLQKRDVLQKASLLRVDPLASPQSQVVLGLGAQDLSLDLDLGPKLAITSSSTLDQWPDIEADLEDQGDDQSALAKLESRVHLKERILLSKVYEFL